MPMKSLNALLAFLIFLVPVTVGGTSAQGVAAVTPPQISYADSSGMSFLATPAKWTVTPKKHLPMVC